MCSSDLRASTASKEVSALAATTVASAPVAAAVEATTATMATAAATATATAATAAEATATAATVARATEAAAIAQAARQQLAKLALRPEKQPSFFADVYQTFKLFWPIFLGQVASTAMSVVDTIMAGAAGTVELSGVAIGVSFYMPAVLLVMGLSLAVQPNVAQLRGAGRLSEIAPKIHTATLVSLATAVIVGIIMCFLPLFYHLVPHIDKEMIRIGQGYLIAAAVGMPAVALFNVLRGYWEGLGITIPTLIFGFTALLLNIPLNWIFIFGHFGAPQLGGIGCGVATSLTLYITVALMFLYVKKHEAFKDCRIYERSYPIVGTEIKQFLAFAFPLALSTTIETTCFSIVALLLSPFGPTTIASHVIALNVLEVICMIPLAIASATTVRVGTAMGSGKWQRSKRITYGVFTLGLSCYLIYFLAVLFGHEIIISWYSSDPEVTPLASVLLLLCVTFLLPDSLQIIGIGVLRGFKDSTTILVVTIICYWVIGLPIGYALAYGHLTGEVMGATGFWIGFIFALSGACVLYLARIIYLFRTRNLPKSFALELD